MKTTIKTPSGIIRASKLNLKPVYLKGHIVEWEDWNAVTGFNARKIAEDKNGYTLLILRAFEEELVKNGQSGNYIFHSGINDENRNYYIISGPLEKLVLKGYKMRLKNKK